MLRSMTAFGRAFNDSSVGLFTVQIHSVNRKHLELATSLPSELLFLDADVRSWTKSKVFRGHVYIAVTITHNEGTPIHLRANLPYVHELQTAWLDISSACKLPPSSFDLSLLQNDEGIFLRDEHDLDEMTCRESLQACVAEALEKLLIAKEQEGSLLLADINPRLDTLATLIAHIEAKGDGAVERYRQKLSQRLEAFLPSSHDENEERILREIAIYSDRLDITEEIVRFRAHLLRFREIITLENEGAIGKNLEFLLQELNREINTIASKSGDFEVSTWAVESKVCLEKIREQVLNVE